MVAEFPHCDILVLHAPGTCQFCDWHPEKQQARSLAGVNYTNQHYADKAPCPSTARRSEETINLWPGNREDGV